VYCIATIIMLSTERDLGINKQTTQTPDIQIYSHKFSVLKISILLNLYQSIVKARKKPFVLAK